MRKKKIWIVHSRADAAEASKLNELLDQQMLDVLNSFVEHEVGRGTPRDEAQRQLIRRADVVIVLLSLGVDEYELIPQLNEAAERSKPVLGLFLSDGKAIAYELKDSKVAQILRGQDHVDLRAPNGFRNLLGRIELLCAPPLKSKVVEPPFEAYIGEEPFLFVSYSHKDSALVYPEIEHLHQLGYRIWYDEGIDPGNEWPEEIAKALDHSSFFAVFVSPRAVESKNVRNEINFALNNSKPFLAIHIEETDLPRGLALRMGDIQAIMSYRMSAESYERKLAKVLPENLLTANADGQFLKPSSAVSTDNRDLERTNLWQSKNGQHTSTLIAGDEPAYVSDERRELNNRLSKIDVISVAGKLVETGMTGLDFGSVAKFGRWATADPTSAKQAEAILNALKQHIQAHSSRGALNLAVFGPSGTGKKFPIQEIARFTDNKSLIPIEVELPSLQGLKDIVPAYRSAQQAALRGQNAILYFEGIDASLDGIPFGWLQHFVRTMRDGEFTDNGVRQPLGRCVLCFVANETVSHHHLTQNLRTHNPPKFLDEFLSHIDFCLDVPGINPLTPEDHVYILQRALALRSMLQIWKRSLDPVLMHALLQVPKYYNHIRSLEAIIKASRPKEDGVFLTADSLPNDSELDLHTDARWLREALEKTST